MEEETGSRSVWVWWVCGLLLMATTINYMDRQTLANVSARIKNEFQLSGEQYGWLEFGFGLSFAAGSSLFGFISDRTNVRWLYPAVLLLWSLMGFLTGFVETYTGLLICRILLGLFESGHWPCALRTTRRLLPPKSWTLGNSVLQSGSAIGAIITPMIMLMMLNEKPGSWRLAFQVIAAVGVLWAVAWLLSTNSRDLAPEPAAAMPEEGAPKDTDTFLLAILTKKFLLLVVVVISINACWHMFRVWMPLFLQKGRGFEEKQMLRFMFWYNVSCDVGCISAGFLTRQLHRSGLSIHGSRCVTFGVCSVLVALGGLIPWLSSGVELVVVLMLVAAGSLGLFPCYYSFSQDLTGRHQGKVTGLLGTIAWVTSSPLHPLSGSIVDKSESYDMGMAVMCGFPLLAFFAISLFWPKLNVDSGYNAEPSTA